MRLFSKLARVHFSLNESNRHLFRTHVFWYVYSRSRNRIDKNTWTLRDEATHTDFMFLFTGPKKPQKIIRIKICPHECVVNKCRRKDDGKRTKKILKICRRWAELLDWTPPDASSVVEFPFFFAKHMSRDFSRNTLSVNVSRSANLYNIVCRLDYRVKFTRRMQTFSLPKKFTCWTYDDTMNFVKHSHSHVCACAQMVDLFRPKMKKTSFITPHVE